MATITTPLTKLFGIKYPIILAGMNVAAGPELAAAVTNSGGLGVIGGVGYTPDFLRGQIALLKKGLNDPNAPFGVDLLLPQVCIFLCRCIDRGKIFSQPSSSCCCYY